MEPKRLYRSQNDRKIAGVAGGLAEYFDTDPTLFRLIFVILAVSGGAGLLIYILLWIVTPERPYHLPYTQTANDPPPVDNPGQSSSWEPGSGSDTQPGPSAPQPEQPVVPSKPGGSLTGGLVLISIGLLFLAAELFPEINFWEMWPVVLIIAGAGLLIRAFVKRNDTIHTF